MVNAGGATFSSNNGLRGCVELQSRLAGPRLQSQFKSCFRAVLHRGDVTDPVASFRKDMAMGTRRLQIVDVERATQPQLSFDQRIAIAFNGEIYNHCELRRELSNLGVVFRTESDTELLASALQFWGPHALERY